jgi:hypothetical protein
LRSLTIGDVIDVARYFNGCLSLLAEKLILVE